jgi:hypothetical protein
VAARVADRAERREELEDLGLVARAAVEVTVDRIAERRGVGAQQLVEHPQPPEAFRRVGRWNRVSLRPLGLESLREGRGGSRSILEIQR